MKYSKVLFLCVENAGRSKMAEAFGKSFGINCESAGTLPSTKVNEIVEEVMKERGIPLVEGGPKLLTEEMIDRSDLVVIMGCSVEESCPAPLARSMKKKVVDWGLDDPKGRSVKEVRKIRDEIEKRVRELSIE